MENYFGEIMNAIGEENNLLKIDNKNLEIQVMYHNPQIQDVQKPSSYYYLSLQDG